MQDLSAGWSGSATRLRGRLFLSAALFVIGLSAALPAVAGAVSSSGWNIQATGDWGVRDVHFVSAEVGWAVGSVDSDAGFSSGSILATTDGGASWTPQAVPPERTADGYFGFSEVAFTDAETGWALGSGRYVGSTVVATINGGQTWNTLTLPSGVEVSDLAAADRLHVWACGKKNDRAAVLASTDGGATWALRRPGSTDAFSGITFINVMRGWVVGDDGGIFATTDGGASWKPQWSRTAADLRDVTFVGRKLGWAVGAKTKVDAGVVVATRDGGLTWTVQSRADWAGGLNHVEFADSTHGWAFGSFNDDEMPVVVATRDSGATWEAQGLPSSIRQVGGAAFQDSRRGWLAGSANSGLVLSTTDGGSSPTLKSVTPLRGRRGTTVTLTGSGLGDTQSVEFGGRPATFSVLADDTVRVVLPYYPGGRVPIFVSTSTHTMVAVRLFTVLVRPRISLRLEGLSGGAFMRLGGRLRVWGSVGPLSCEGERVRLPVQHRQGSRWRRVARPAATVKYGSFGPVSFKPAARGAYRIKAAMERTVLHPASWTRWFPFEVK